MAHAGLCSLIKQFGVGRLTRQRLHGKWGDELCCASRQHYAHLSTLLFQQSDQFCALIRCNAARDGDQDVALV